MMDVLDRTLLAKNDEELKQVYDDEVKKLKENEFKLKILQKLRIEDFPKITEETSKRNIEKALISIVLRDHINLGQGQKVLNLDDFDMSKIALSFIEKKFIREKVEQLVSIEKNTITKQYEEWEKINKELEKENVKFDKLLNDNNEKAKQLLELKQQEFDLMKEVAEALASPAQMNQVQGILEESKIVELQLSTLNGIIKDSEKDRNRYAKRAFAEVESNIDALLEQKNARK